MKNIHKIEKQLYITNDENIKEGDLVMSNYGELIKISYKGSKVKENVNEYCKKIILTTDQDLIKDGVQAIDDEFLEWFVKNPSCDFVKVEVDLSKHNGEFQTKYGYKIIITKKEPKQETIEKAAENYSGYEEHRMDFIAGTKWQQEISYSEQDMIEFAYKYTDERRNQGARAMTPELLIKQFKKK